MTPKRYEVLFRPRAESDLVSLFRYIAQHSSKEIAARYLDRIEAACLSLSTFPERGTAVPGRVSGLRTMGFERRVTILFRIGEQIVEILRILYGGREVPEPNREVKSNGNCASRESSLQLGARS